jgi:hypothetical protein
MWSSNRHDERLLDIACRRSTPNSLDDSAGQELGEVNLLLEQRFSQPVPPPENLTWDAVTRLIMTAPAPQPPMPWWKVALQPGQLAAACAVAGLAVAAFVSLPIYRTQVPAIEGTVYARGNDAALSLPPPAALLPSKHGKITFTKEVTVGSDEAGHHINIEIQKHITSPVPLSTDSTELTPKELHQEIREYATITQTEDISGASMMENVREMNAKAGGGGEYIVSPKQITIEERISMMEAFKQHFGGEGFLPQTGNSEEHQIIVLSNESLPHITAADIEHMSEEDLLKLMELEMKRLSEQDAEAGGSSAPRTTGRQP